MKESRVLELIKGDSKTPGTWQEFRMGDRHYVLCTCPRCGRGGVIQTGDRTEDHAIAADGAVTPSIECPYRGCDFHDHVRLLGWAAPLPAG